MKFTSTVVVGFSALALAVGAAWAEDKTDKANDATFKSLDRNHDGYISPAEARGNAKLSKDFKTFDLNNDGKLNHAEYVAAIMKEDAVGVKDKVVDKVSSSKNDTTVSANSNANAAASTPMAAEKKNPGGTN